MSSTQYDDAILDSNAIDPTDKNGNPIPCLLYTSDAADEL